MGVDVVRCERVAFERARGEVAPPRAAGGTRRLSTPAADTRQGGKSFYW